jgi:hypothetical protein
MAGRFVDSCLADVEIAMLITEQRLVSLRTSGPNTTPAVSISNPLILRYLFSQPRASSS